MTDKLDFNLDTKPFMLFHLDSLDSLNLIAKSFFGLLMETETLVKSNDTMTIPTIGLISRRPVRR